MWHQAIHRCWRFGQLNAVTVDTVATEGTRGVLNNLQSKEAKVAKMFSRLVELMNHTLKVNRSTVATKEMECPAWLSATK
jgi:hypothetical protein